MNKFFLRSFHQLGSFSPIADHWLILKTPHIPSIATGIFYRQMVQATNLAATHKNPNLFKKLESPSVRSIPSSPLLFSSFNKQYNKAKHPLDKTWLKILLPIIWMEAEVKKDELTEIFQQGEEFSENKQHIEAILCFQRIPKNHELYVRAQLNAGIIFLNDLKRYEEAIECFQRVPEGHADYTKTQLYLGITFANMNYYEEAIKCYRQIPKEDECYGEAQFQQGDILSILECYEEAFWCFKHVPEGHEDYIPAQINQGVMLSHLKRYEEALACYRRVPEDHKLYVRALFNQYAIFYRLNRSEEALACIKLVPKEHIDYVSALIRQGIVFLSLQRDEEALRCFEQISKEDKFYASAQYYLGVAFSNLDRNEEALQCFMQIPKEHEFYGAVQHNLGIVLEKMNRYQEAIECHQRVPEGHEHYIDAIINMGACLHKLNLHIDALACYKRVPKTHSRYTDVQFNQALSLQKLKRYEEAVVFFEQISQNHNLYIEGQFQQGVALLYLNRYAEALKCFQQIPETHELFTSALLNQAHALYGLNKITAALEYLQRVPKKNNKYSDAKFTQGTTLFHLKRYIEAIDCFQQVQKENENYITAQFNTGLSFMELNEPEKALEYFNRIPIFHKLKNILFSNFRASIKDKENLKTIYKVIDGIIQNMNPNEAIYYELEKVYLLIEEQEAKKAEDLLIKIFDRLPSISSAHLSDLTKEKAAKANLKLMNSEINRRIKTASSVEIKVIDGVRHYDYAYLSFRVYKDYEKMLEIESLSSKVKNVPSGTNVIIKKDVNCPENANPFFTELNSSFLWEKMPGDWQKYKEYQKEFSEDHQHGYYGVAYINHQQQEIIIAHKGTVNYQDIITDAFFALLGYPAKQFATAYYFSQSVWDEIEKNPELKHYARSHTGHSLGALLAEITAYHEAKDFNCIRTVVTFDSPGSGSLLKYMNGHTGVSYSYMTSYVAEPNYINTGAEHIGTLLRIYPYKYGQEAPLWVSTQKLLALNSFSPLLGILTINGIKILRDVFFNSKHASNSSLSYYRFKSFPILSALFLAGGTRFFNAPQANEKKVIMGGIGALIYWFTIHTLSAIGRLYFPNGGASYLSTTSPITITIMSLTASIIATLAAVVSGELVAEVGELTNSHRMERLLTVFEREQFSAIPRQQNLIYCWPGGGDYLLQNIWACYQANRAAEKTLTLELDDFSALGDPQQNNNKNLRPYYQSLVEHQIRYKATEIDRFALPLHMFSPQAQDFLQTYQENTEEALKNYPSLKQYRHLLALYEINKQTQEIKLKRELSKKELSQLGSQYANLEIIFPTDVEKVPQTVNLAIFYPFTIHEFKDFINRQCARTSYTLSVSHLGFVKKRDHLKN